jgi:hypothetical protein
VEGCIHAHMHTHTPVVYHLRSCWHAPPLLATSPLSGCDVMPSWGILLPFLGRGRDVLIAPAAVATIPPGGHIHTSWELWREGVVRAGVERERCRTEGCG